MSRCAMDEGRFGTVHPKAGLRLHNTPCKICTAQASGVHYGVTACEGCKAFYRRTVSNNTIYRCYLGSQCHVGPKARGRCRACRFQKCLDLGMRFHATRMGRTPLYKQETNLGSPEPMPLPAKKIKTEHHDQETSIELEMNPTFQHCNSEQAQYLRQSSQILSVRRDLTVDGLMETVKFLPDRIHHRVCLDKFTNQDWCTWSGTDQTDLFLEDTMRNTSTLHSTVKAISDTVQAIYGQDFLALDAFMNDCLMNGNVPYQPQVSLQTFIENSHQAVKDSVWKHCSLTMALPGFMDFCESDRQALLSDRWSEGWAISRYPYIRNNESYSLSGPLQIHYSKYWMQQMMEPEYISAIFAFCETLNSLQLNRVEAFLLYAISIFNPDATNVYEKPRLSFLYAHYMECLLYVLHSDYSRCGSIEADRQRKERILNFTQKIRGYNLIGKKYVRWLASPRTPFHPEFEEADTAIASTTETK